MSAAGTKPDENSCQQPTAYFHPTENGKARYVRTKGEWRFQAVITEGEGDAKPAVITILRGGKGKKRRD